MFLVFFTYLFILFLGAELASLDKGIKLHRLGIPHHKKKKIIYNIKYE